MGQLKIDAIAKDNNQVSIDFRTKGSLGKFFKEKQFFAKYPFSVEDIPDEILIIPFLSTAAPIAWATHSDIHIQAIDKTFLESLYKIQKELNNFYPSIKFSGKIVADKVTDCNQISSGKTMTLFSGGVDSLATYVRHRKEKPLLIDIYSRDVYGSKKAKDACNNYTKKFSEEHQVESCTVYSNFYDIKDDTTLALFSSKLGGGWWIKVMHGFAYLGICAPIAYKKHITTVYIPSSFTKRFTNPWGSSPEVDNNVAWGNTRCIHDCYDLSRQEKLELIADYVKETKDYLFIVCCNSSEEYYNCCQCEKCTRTIVGLTLAGLDPKQHGFLDHPNFAVMKKKLEAQTWPFNDSKLYMWTDLKNHIHKEAVLSANPEIVQFIDWLSVQDTESFWAKPKQPFVSHVAQIYLKVVPNRLWRNQRELYLKVQERYNKKGKKVTKQ